MSDDTKFTRYGRTCPKSCTELCCIICTNCSGGIEFIPTMPSLDCTKEAPEVKHEGRNCKVFNKLTFKEEHCDQNRTRRRKNARL